MRFNPKLLLGNELNKLEAIISFNLYLCRIINIEIFQLNYVSFEYIILSHCKLRLQHHENLD